MSDLSRAGRAARWAAAAVVLAALSWVGASEHLRVTGHGVGTGVEDRELRGESDTFPEGVEVWFWTRVEGGEAGDRIRHVWFEGDEQVLEVGLSIGGSHWRTYSNKMMHPGSAGEWKVQAQDMDGNVLAESTFTCAPAEDGGS